MLRLVLPDIMRERRYVTLGVRWRWWWWWLCCWWWHPHRYILGESPTIRNFFVATGMNSSGVAGSGGCGKAIAEWIVEGQPTSDLWAIDVRRYGAFHDNRLYVRDAVVSLSVDHAVSAC